MSYDASNDQTTFRSGSMTVAQAMGSGFSSTSLVLNAMAKCAGRDCRPERVRLSFSVNGSSDFALSDRTVSITADDETFTWSNEEQWNSSEDVSVSTGRIVAVPLPISDLTTIANASSLTGRLGSTPLDLGGRVQSKLKEFVQTVKNPEAARSASEEGE
jgi:hypothetical protein